MMKFPSNLQITSFGSRFYFETTPRKVTIFETTPGEGFISESTTDSTSHLRKPPGKVLFLGPTHQEAFHFETNPEERITRKCKYTLWYHC